MMFCNLLFLLVFMYELGREKWGGPFVHEQASSLSSLSPKHQLILFNTFFSIPA